MKNHLLIQIREPKFNFGDDWVNLVKGMVIGALHEMKGEFHPVKTPERLTEMLNLYVKHNPDYTYQVKYNKENETLNVSSEYKNDSFNIPV